jgi:Gpi18-like mannosyltransferase
MPYFLIVLFLGMVIRLFLIGSTGFIADVSFWKSWSMAVLDHGIVWAAHNTNSNYPPGFLWILGLMGKIYSLFGDPHNFDEYWRENNYAFLFSSKIIAILTDVGIAYLLYWFTSQKEKLKELGATIYEESGKETKPALSIFNSINLPVILAGGFFLHPVVWIDSALWGQVESFGMIFTIGAIILLFYKHPLLASAIFMIGPMMKLQNIIFIPMFFLFIARYYDVHTLIKSIAAAAVSFFLVNLPFVLINDMQQVQWLLTVNNDYFPWLSLNAHNLWWIVAGANGMKINDKLLVLGILNAKQVGLLLFSSSYLLGCILIFLRPTPRNFLASLSIGIFSFFLFTTQSHERYSYPVLVLLLFLYPFLEPDFRRAYLHIKQKIRHKQLLSKEGAWLDVLKGSYLDAAIRPAMPKYPTNYKLKSQSSLTIHPLTNESSLSLSKIYRLLPPFHKYFWIVYMLLSWIIFFNLHHGLVANYPQNGFGPLTAITSPQLTIFNAYLMVFSFFLLIPIVMSQLPFEYFFLCVALLLFGLIMQNSSYIFKGQVSVTALKPIIKSQGFGDTETNMTVSSFSGWKSWNRLSNNYYYYRNGFGTHANGNLTFDIGKRFSRLSTDVGVDTEAGTGASVIFQIFGDGNKLYESKKLGRFDYPVHVDIDVTGVKYLGLIVNDAGDGIGYDHADWLNPMLYK